MVDQLVYDSVCSDWCSVTVFNHFIEQLKLGQVENVLFEVNKTMLLLMHEIGVVVLNEQPIVDEQHT